MLTDQEIETGKRNLNSIEEIYHEHNDCIRIAYVWLDAQKKTKRPTKYDRAIKHIIEAWGGRYVSQTDVEVAAALHPDICGTYPNFNISAHLIRPARSRLEAISEAGTQPEYLNNYQDVYSKSE
jgi:hypothetical protein